MRYRLTVKARIQDLRGFPLFLVLYGGQLASIAAAMALLDDLSWSGLSRQAFGTPLFFSAIWTRIAGKQPRSRKRTGR